MKNYKTEQFKKLEEDMHRKREIEMKQEIKKVLKDFDSKVETWINICTGIGVVCFCIWALVNYIDHILFC